MRTTIATIILLLSLSAQGIKAAKTEYYFDSTISFDAAIPSPEAFLGYEIGSRVTEHSRINAYTDDPLLNGYIAPGQLSQLKSSASIAAVSSGRGQVILFAGNPLFRGIWDATSRTFVNAIVFGNIVPEQR